MRLTLKLGIFLLLSLAVLTETQSTSASPSLKIAAGIVSNVTSVLLKWICSLNTPPPKAHIATPGCSLIKFEGEYSVETVLDGRKLGIDPYSVEVSSTGELIILDSINSNVHKVSSPLSKYSRPKLLTGSHEGYTGHVDGKLREAKMHQPKGVAVDDRGNVYIADTMNMAIRKISNSGVVTTIAGGRMSRGSHADGPSEDAKFSDDFDVAYVRNSCSLLIVDRGSQVIREIQLQHDDCNASKQPQSQDIEDNFNLAATTQPITGKSLIEQKLAAARAAQPSKPSSPSGMASVSKLHDLELVDEIGVNAQLAFQDALSLKERMNDLVEQVDEFRSRLISAESRAQEAEQRLKEVQNAVADIKADQEQQHADKIASEAERIKLKYARIASDIGAYFSLKVRIEMMEEFQSGRHESWNMSNEVSDLQMLYPDGQPGVELLGLAIMKCPETALVETLGIEKSGIFL